MLGRQVQLLIEDNKSDPKEAATAAEKLIVRDKVPVMMGAWSSTYTLAVMPKLMEYKVPMLVEADAAVRRGEAVAAYLLPPTTLGRIMALVERGGRLPQKSTYFWPKPLTGMVMMPLDPTPFPQGSSRAAQDRAAGAAANQTDRADRAS